MVRRLQVGEAKIVGDTFDFESGLNELARLRAAIDASGDVVYDWDLATDRLVWSGQAEILFNGRSDTLPTSGEDFNNRISHEDLPLRLSALSEHFAGEQGFDCEFRVRTNDGEFQWIHDRGSAFFSANGTPQRLVGTLRLINTRKEHEAQLEYLANFDDLTGHFNKLRLREALEHALAYSIRFDSPSAFMMIGIDQLGLMNTAYGFEVGDAILVEVARRLDQYLRNCDVVGRPSGDRFGIILSGNTVEEARITAERILASLRRDQIEAGDHRLTISASVGVVGFPGQSKTSFDVMAKAESAMLKAKSLGRDCVHVFEITETAALQDIEESARFVHAVRDLGCKVALDDFGAGYTTFRHMKALTVDVVKIDGSFVKGIHESEENLMFVRNLLNLAKALGVKTVAECIEELAEAEVLSQEGVDYFQGYYFGRPEVWVGGQPTAQRTAAQPQPFAQQSKESNLRLASNGL